MRLSSLALLLGRNDQANILYMRSARYDPAGILTWTDAPILDPPVSSPLYLDDFRSIILGPHQEQKQGRISTRCIRHF
jgi:hypothetical protein